jgi:hypothetical protein
MIKYKEIRIHGDREENLGTHTWPEQAPWRGCEGSTQTIRRENDFKWTTEDGELILETKGPRRLLHEYNQLFEASMKRIERQRKLARI